MFFKTVVLICILTILVWNCLLHHILPTWDILLKMNSWIIYTYESLCMFDVSWFGGSVTFTHTCMCFLFTGWNLRTVEQNLSLQSHISDVAWAPPNDSWKVCRPLTKPHKDLIPQENRRCWGRRDLFCLVGQVFSWRCPLWFRELSQSSLTCHPWPARSLHLSHHGLSHIPPRLPQHTLVCLTLFLFLDLNPGNPQVTLTSLLSFSSSRDSSHTTFALAHDETLLLILFFGYCNLCDEKDVFSLKRGAPLKMSASSVHWSIWDTWPDEQTREVRGDWAHAVSSESGSRLMTA